MQALDLVGGKFGEVEDDVVNHLIRSPALVGMGEEDLDLDVDLVDMGWEDQ